MIYINLDKAINGELLKKELFAQGLDTDVVVYTFDDGQKIQLNNVQEDDRALAQSIYSSHNPPAPIEPTVQEKLASVGLSIDDLKQALSL